MKNRFKKELKFIKKHYFIISIILLCIIRFLYTYKLPNFYIFGMNYDDKLMIDQTKSLLSGDYLGTFNIRTLIKGPIFPMLLYIINIFRMGYSSTFTILYILSCIYFMCSIKNIIKNEKYLIIIFGFLLFNPVTFSQDLFQRLYRNSISMTLFMFFIGTIIRILSSKKIKISNYILFGICLSIMFLTREDNIWTYPTILFIIIYNFIKDKTMKTIFINIIPIIILILSLNLMSFINYKNYGIYTYNEIQKSNFHNTYKKILQIKDDEKINMVSIPKSTLIKLVDNVKSLNIDREKLDHYYELATNDINGEIYNGDIIWYFRNMIYSSNKYKSGRESEEIYRKIGIELDELFKNGTFEKEFIMPSIFMAVPTKENVVDIFKNTFYAIGYTASYKDIKTLTDVSNYKYDSKIGAYAFIYKNYHNTIDIVEHNEFRYEIIRLVYSILTVVFGIISLFIYFKNIYKIDNINIINHILVISYLLIIGGIVYTHVTSFHAIRPLYLGNIYVIETIFILLNIYRQIEKKINLNH